MLFDYLPAHVILSFYPYIILSLHPSAYRTIYSSIRPSVYLAFHLLSWSSVYRPRYSFYYVAAMFCDEFLPDSICLYSCCCIGYRRAAPSLASVHVVYYRMIRALHTAVVQACLEVNHDVYWVQYSMLTGSQYRYGLVQVCTMLCLVSLTFKGAYSPNPLIFVSS